MIIKHSDHKHSDFGFVLKMSQFRNYPPEEKPCFQSSFNFMLWDSGKNICHTFRTMLIVMIFILFIGDFVEVIFVIYCPCFHAETFS